MGITRQAADAAWGWADEPVAAPDALPCPELLDYDLQSDGSFAVWLENWDTVLLFWACRRCWRLKPMGGVIGMDWTTIHAKLQMKGLSGDALARESSRLELMEDAVMEVLA